MLAEIPATAADQAVAERMSPTRPTLSMPAVVATLQVVLATRRAVRNAARASILEGRSRP